jgi:hypothetical protein
MGGMQQLPCSFVLVERGDSVAGVIPCFQILYQQHVRIKWTVVEDMKLKDGSSRAWCFEIGGNSQLVPGRSKSQCYSRWIY